MVGILFFLVVLVPVHAFVVRPVPARASPSATSLASTARPTHSASSSSLQAGTEARRKELLTRRGPYFKLNRSNGKIEFGATANLVTKLSGSPAQESIAAWLQDERGLALSIWDEQLVTPKGKSVYRLQTMNLQFVTLTLAPWVDVEMKTLLGTNHQPVFCLQSVDFDPNLQILPGMAISAASLGIVIEVVGQLRPAPDGQSVVGAIAFQTSGELPPPLRLLPDRVLQAASDTINETVVEFAVKSFQKGATAKYREFVQQRQ